MFNTYTNGSRTIMATELAYKVIYREQGFMPADEVKVPGETVEPNGGSPGETVEPDDDSPGEGVDADGAADKSGSGEPDTGEAQTAKRRRKAE
ncbi:hypothetical protein [Anaerovibrio sp.]|uniref:hypothetical protein n=1 Tax=Anaerovibrio sp. TaxID=1872532 RepID=UPI00260CAB48|nr:hypothetical protein [Anaerovibrio sp.]MDD6598378.1 hypothetical protein [Anaerovibrio sp.]